MMRSVTKRPAEWYRELYDSRRALQDPDIARMRKAQAYLNDDVDIVITELDKMDKPAVANLAKLGLRQLAQRVASVEPTIYFPSHSLGSDKADKDAVKRGQVVRGWFADNSMRLRNAQRSRHLLAYACCPIVFAPDPKRRIPAAFVRHPLNTFPADCDFFKFTPDNVIFTTTRSYEWFLTTHPHAADLLNKPKNWDPQRPNLQEKFTVLEYMDDREITYVAVGSDADNDPYDPTDVEPSSVILASTHNLAGHPLAVIPGSINLDKQEGQFDGIFGMYQAQAYLMAMSLVATKLSVFRPAWAYSNPGEDVEVVSVPDPFTGQPGEVKGGRIEYQQLDPALQTLEIGSQLEYAARQTAGLPAEFGGMSPTNVRTGRRASQVMSNTIDFTVSESQDIFAKSTRDEVDVQIALDKGYFNEPKRYFVVTRNFSGKVEYTPSNLFPDPCPVQVDYPMGGVDLQNLPIEGGQRISMKTMSRRRFMSIDPAIPDADTEEQILTMEALSDAFTASILAQASDPMAQAYSPEDLAMIMQKVEGGMKLTEAVIAQQAAAQERQAAVAPAGSPALMPGMTQPGGGAEGMAPPADDKSMGNMSQLLSQLGTVQQAQNSRGTNGSI